MTVSEETVAQTTFSPNTEGSCRVFSGGFLTNNSGRNFIPTLTIYGIPAKLTDKTGE